MGSTTTCARCGRACAGDACPHCGGVEAVSPGLLAMPGEGDAVWTRVALVGTALVTVAIAAWLLYMTVRGLHLGRN